MFSLKDYFNPPSAETRSETLDNIMTLRTNKLSRPQKPTKSVVGMVSKHNMYKSDRSSDSMYDTHDMDEYTNTWRKRGHNIYGNIHGAQPAQSKTRSVMMSTYGGSGSDTFYDYMTNREIEMPPLQQKLYNPATYYKNLSNQISKKYYSFRNGSA